MQDFSYIGVGKVRIKEHGAEAALQEVGNASELNISVDEDVKKQRNFQTVGGGTQNEVRRVDSVQISMSLYNVNAANLARHTNGASSAIPVTPIVDEPHTAYAGGFIPTNFPAAGAIVVKEGSTTLTLGTDYTLEPGGIVVVSGGALSDGNTALLSYTPAAGNVVEWLVASPKEYTIHFSGLNEARSGKPHVVTVHRCRFGVVKNVKLIGDDYAVLEIEGEALFDSDKAGEGLSPYVSQVVVT